MLNNQASVDEVLAHFGVKGMHWGVRRNLVDSGASDDHATAKALKKKSRFKGAKVLSNAEMEVLIRRMNLEQQLTSLKKDRHGETFAKELLKEVGKQQARQAANLAARGIGMMLKKALGR